MFELPSKTVPFIVLAFVNFVAFPAGVVPFSRFVVLFLRLLVSVSSELVLPSRFVVLPSRLVALSSRFVVLKSSPTSPQYALSALVSVKVTSVALRLVVPEGT